MSSYVAEAILEDGRRLPYVVVEDPPRGGMKHTYFSPDRSYVVQFFNCPEWGSIPNIRARLEAILGRYNPTLPEASGGAIGNDQNIADYFSHRFCWPTALVKWPEFGIVCPAYPANFFFDEHSSLTLNLRGKDKRSNWFTTQNRKYLNASELGDLRSMFSISLLLARSVRRMHQAGLAHSDLSNNNVLIDPKSGSCVVIDIDSLVVPGLFPPEVVGTRGYIAPEILETYDYGERDPRRKTPSVETDLHSLPVLIYEYLFYRHPLIGPKIYSRESAEEDDFLALGPMATFIEHPADHSNRPEELKAVIGDLGPVMEKLFLRAFVEGLHDASRRPTALEWERGLARTMDLLHPCANRFCDHRWFVLHDPRKPFCPYCGTRIREPQVVRLKRKAELRGRIGRFWADGELDLIEGTELHRWHFNSDVFPDEKADAEVQARIERRGESWLLRNERAEGLISPQGTLVPKGESMLLYDGAVFRGSREERGSLMEVEIQAVQ